MPVDSVEYYLLRNKVAEQLMCIEVNVSNMGWYKCEARNHGGSGDAEIYISVSGNWLKLYLILSKN